MPLDYWKERFQTANPNQYHQFKNKTPEKKDQMATAALYKARQPNNENFVSEDAMMGKIADSGKIIRILKKAHTVPFSDEKNWLLVDTDPGKGNSGLGIKWIPADTRFEWVRPYRDTVEQGVAESATVTRIDSKPITNFGSNLKAYKHTDDWSQSGVDTGDDSYWKNKNLKTNTTKGLFAGDPRRTALYATGNAYETRYVEFTQDGQPIVYFDRKDLPAMRSRKTYLTVFDASDFRQLPTGEWFSENPRKPIKQVPIGDPFKYIADQGWIIRVTDDLDKVFKQVQKMHKAGKIAHYGAEGMNESTQGVAEGQGEQISKTKALNTLRKELMNSYEYMKCANLEEFKHRLQWLSEGMLKNHMTDGKSTVINREEIELYQEYRKKREQIQQGLTKGIDENFANSAEAYRAHLIKTLPQIMKLFANIGKGWIPSKEQMLIAVDTAYQVMKHTGDVKQAGKVLMDELNTLYRMSQGKQDVNENFADGRNPQDKGDAKRHGVPTKGIRLPKR